ncbi:predicted protein [Phaeodactylum tricornutum CCAP 1055/1]|uniref:PPIase cyclophilin-type domain-containing protein n=1 Tax=Phaeodactylum tricornutum (strain CCAP 1055/1) TaxID=556484 RepID=B7G921_PHATC|nr:predicted protein [Phaeodactylum tricornutum CCAP 1055/1]EEC44748.1 predicted protein [Phaeodactylum tricornutum CCAP 1055/1]|eukprot:XP_002183566.1 predicted protein [Phaeodactylum tricornutum CCAP 1055/1]
MRLQRLPVAPVAVGVACLLARYSSAWIPVSSSLSGTSTRPPPFRVSACSMTRTLRPNLSPETSTRIRICTEPYNESNSRRHALVSRRDTLQTWLMVPLLTAAIVALDPDRSLAAPPSTKDATITDKIFITVKGLPKREEEPEFEPKRIVIGLFGTEAPESVDKLKRLVASSSSGQLSNGLAIPCRPKATRTLQKEQLEANKVYNSCVEGEDQGVTLQYSSIWRVFPNERIDMGAVTGKFVAREYPNWQETVESELGHDQPGVVSVRRGNDSGFGFTIYPGGAKDPVRDLAALNADHIVVGRVIEGMDIVAQLNSVPVISSSKLNYMSLTGGQTTKNAPTRSCRYGGDMYCNENKPLIKLSITETGIL